MAKKIQVPIPDIIVLYLVYGEEHASEGLEVLNKIAKRMFPGSSIRVVIIDNALPADYQKEKSGNIVIGGENSMFEFSGWDRGVRYMLKNMGAGDSTLVFFANDTFHRRAYKDGGDFLDVFDRAIVENRDFMNSAIGYLDDFPKNVVLNGIVYNSWIRSNIFILPANLVKKLYPLSYHIDPSEIFSSNADEFWSDTDLISDNWKAYISSWLFGKSNDAYPEYSLHWIKAEPYNAENREFFKKKALCILSEHYLTARLFDWGVPIIDTNIYGKKPDRHIAPYYNH